MQDVADRLRPHGLTLANYASIREQTVGGFTQVSAHGTGAAIPPVDEQVVALKLVTPALGTLELSRVGAGEEEGAGGERQGRTAAQARPCPLPPAPPLHMCRTRTQPCLTLLAWGWGAWAWWPR